MYGLSAMTKNVSLVERLLLMKVWLYYGGDCRILGPTSVIPIDCYGTTVESKERKCSSKSTATDVRNPIVVDFEVISFFFCKLLLPWSAAQ